MKITLTVPPPVYQEAFEIAHSSNRTVEEVLRESVQWFFPPFHVSEDTLVMEREVAMFEDTHTDLWKQYPNRYIAMYQGQVIDDDNDLVTLALRIEEQYPDEVVLIRQVLPELPQPLIFRSPRLVRNDSLLP